MYNGYDFYIDGMKLPFAPPSMQITVGSKNETLDLINEGEVNILKSPSLTEISFTARFPMRRYPYAPRSKPFEYYWEKLKTLKNDKTPFVFIVARATPDGNATWDTDMRMAIESLTIQEDADEGDDVLVEIELKQYKSYGTKTAKVEITPDGTQQVPATPDQSRDAKATTQTTYTIQSGDCLWNIAKAAYGDGSKWSVIYEANKAALDAAAQAHGKASSSDGQWIFPGTKIVVPDAKTAELNVTKLKAAKPVNNPGTNGTYNENRHLTAQKVPAQKKLTT